MTLMFVRHGESEGNRLGVAQGWLDYPLTEKGRNQARAVAIRLAKVNAVSIYSSDLSRASETGEIIAAAHNITAVTRPDLREQHFGERQGLTWSQVVERWGERVRIGDGQIPDEETTAELRERVSLEFDLLSERHKNEIAICVAHGGTIRSVIAHVLDLPQKCYPSVELENCSITVVDSNHGRLLIASLNDHCHLEDVP